MVSATTTCYPRKIAAAVDMWITRYASYRTYPPHNNNSNLSRISVVDPERPPDLKAMINRYGRFDLAWSFR